MKMSNYTADYICADLFALACTIDLVGLVQAHSKLILTPTSAAILSVLTFQHDSHQNLSMDRTACYKISLI